MKWTGTMGSSKGVQQRLHVRAVFLRLLVVFVVDTNSRLDICNHFFRVRTVVLFGLFARER